MDEVFGGAVVEVFVEELLRAEETEVGVGLAEIWRNAVRLVVGRDAEVSRGSSCWSENDPEEEMVRVVGASRKMLSKKRERRGMVFPGGITDE